MKLIFGCLIKHKFLSLLICLLLFLFPLIVVYFLFRWHTSFTCISAELSVGDLLSYMSAFEAFIGTLILGAITVYQAEQSNHVNEQLSQENNFLQKVNAQKMLPLIGLDSVNIYNSSTTSKVYSPDKAETVEVIDKVTPKNRYTIVNVIFSHTNQAQDRYLKSIKILLRNISDCAISQISIDCIEFPGINYDNATTSVISCKGKSDSKYISWLLLPDQTQEITIQILFDSLIYKDFWEHEDIKAVGCFDMCLYITVKGLTGVACKEKISISKATGFKERIMYKADIASTNTI